MKTETRIYISVLLLLAACGVFADDDSTDAVDKSPGVQVTAWGEAASSDPDAREKAIADGLRNALLASVGAYVESTQVGSDYELVKNEILLKTAGFAVLDSVESTEQSRGILRVKIRATVSPVPLYKRLKELGIARDWQVLLDISATKSGKPVAGVVSSSVDRLTRRLAEVGFSVVDLKSLTPDDIRALDRIRSASASGQTPPAAAIKGFDIAILGEGVLEDVDTNTIGGIILYRSSAKLVLRAYNPASGAALHSESAKTDGVEKTRQGADQWALALAADSAGRKLAERLLLLSAERSSALRLRVEGLKTNYASALEREMRSIPGVERVVPIGYDGAVTQWDVHIKSEFRDGFVSAVESTKTAVKRKVRVVAWSKTYVMAEVLK